MSATTTPSPPVGNLASNSSSFSSAATSSSSSTWDRLTTWASENQALVCTVGAVAVIITGAGAVYYLSDSKRGPTGDDAGTAGAGDKRKSKKERRKAKEQAKEQVKIPSQDDAEKGIVGSGRCNSHSTVRPILKPCRWREEGPCRRG